MIQFGFTAAIVVVGCACVAMAVYSRKAEGDALSPMLILSGIFLVLYVMRPLYILSTDRIGPTRALDDRAVGDEMVNYMTEGLVIVFAGLVAFIAGYVLHARGQPQRLGTWKTVGSVVPREWRTVLRPRAAPLVLIWCGAIAAALYGQLIRDAGGISSYLEALSLRSDFFFGRAYLTAAALPLKMAALVLVAFWISRSQLTRRRHIVLWGLVGAVGVGDLLTGGRAAILLGTLLPVVVLVHYLRRRLTPRGAIALVAAGLVLFVGVRVVTRDAVYAAGATPQRGSLLVDALRNLPATTVGGRDAIPFDSLVRVVEAEHARAELQWGRTYLPVLTFPIPRRWWTQKPLGGGNTWFTTTYYPAYYSAGKIETSLSFIGELYANFALPGVIMGMGLLGLLVSRLYQVLLSARSLLAVLFYTVSVGYVFTLLRGDLFHSLTNWGLTLAAGGQSGGR